MSPDCPKCAGRGWLPARRSTDFPEVCPVCGGRTKIRTLAFARLLRVDRGDIYAVERGRAGTVRGSRVLEAIARVFPGELGIKSIRDRVANL